MRRIKSTKTALLFSVLSMVLCIAMLVGSTFAWFTDTATAGINSIQAGTLNVVLQKQVKTTGEGGTENLSWQEVGADETLGWITADGRAQTKILWEPGCTYFLPTLKIVNNGNLAFKYKVTVNVGSGDIELLKVIDFTVLEDGATEAQPLADWEGILLPAGATATTGTNEVAGETKAFTISGHMQEDATNEYQGKKLTGIRISVVATQYTYESDSNGNGYDAAAEFPAPVATRNEFVNAMKAGGKVILAQDIALTINATTITKDAVIDLNGHTLKGATYKSALNVKDATVTIKNGTIEATPNTAGSVLYAFGTSNVTVENCTLKSNGNKSYVICTNGSQSTNTTMVIKDSTISAPNVANAKGYAAYIPAGNVSLLNCNVTGHLFISGGDVTIDGGTYTATGFGKQSKIWHKDDTISFVGGSAGGTAINMGDSILIADRRNGYSLTGLTIKNVTFHTEIPGLGTAYAIKYVDMNQNGAADRVAYVVENNTYNSSPTMFIDLAGTDLAATI